jgi:hypothetical protein
MTILAPRRDHQRSSGPVAPGGRRSPVISHGDRELAPGSRPATSFHPSPAPRSSGRCLAFKVIHMRLPMAARYQRPRQTPAIACR